MVKGSAVFLGAVPADPVSQFNQKTRTDATSGSLAPCGCEPDESEKEGRLDRNQLPRLPTWSTKSTIVLILPFERSLV